VATVVITGKCQNSHTIVAADSAKIANNATMFVRECDESVMPFIPRSVPNSATLIQVALLNDHIVNTPNAVSTIRALFLDASDGPSTP
jgi:hypothetical protein